MPVRGAARGRPNKPYPVSASRSLSSFLKLFTSECCDPDMLAYPTDREFDGIGDQSSGGGRNPSALTITDADERDLARAAIISDRRMQVRSPRSRVTSAVRWPGRSPIPRGRHVTPARTRRSPSRRRGRAALVTKSPDDSVLEAGHDLDVDTMDAEAQATACAVTALSPVIMITPIPSSPNDATADTVGSLMRSAQWRRTLPEKNMHDFASH